MLYPRTDLLKRKIGSMEIMAYIWVKVGQVTRSKRFICFGSHNIINLSDTEDLVTLLCGRPASV